MASWCTIYQNEEYEAEIQVGLYDQWLQQLEYGPTQADRALHHTDMLDIADERRFAICQADMDMSPFEADHCHRIQQIMDRVESHFATHASTTVCDAEGHWEEALIGLARSSSQKVPSNCSQFDARPIISKASLIQNQLNDMLCRTQQRNKKRRRLSSEDVSADSTDEEDYMRFQARAFEELVTKKKARALLSTALQCKPVRHRIRQDSTLKDPWKRKSYIMLSAADSV